MKRTDRDMSTPKVAIATLNAKAYYTLTLLLKGMNVSYESITPGEVMNLDVRLILTTRSEKEKMGGRETLCLEDMSEDLALAKEKIFSILYRSEENALIIGVDPGERTGIVAYYREKEVLEEVTRSLRETILKVGSLVRSSQAERKVVRIGDGNLKMAQIIAERLLQSFRDQVEIEIVDERGTSTIANTHRIREARDLKSARMISFRRGRKYQT